MLFFASSVSKHCSLISSIWILTGAVSPSMANRLRSNSNFLFLLVKVTKAKSLCPQLLSNARTSICLSHSAVLEYILWLQPHRSTNEKNGFTSNIRNIYCASNQFLKGSVFRINVFVFASRGIAEGSVVDMLLELIFTEQLKCCIVGSVVNRYQR